MLYNFLASTEKRVITTCNFNQHIYSKHPDRIMHEHDLIYIRDGEWEISQDGIDYPIRTGDVMLLQGGHHHYGTVRSARPVKTCYIHFSSDSTDFIDKARDSADLFFQFPIVVSCADNPIIEKFFSRVIYSFWDDNRYSHKKAAAYLDLLLCELSNTEQRKSSVVNEIQMLIRKTPNRFISNAEFAALAHCSIRTISTKFKAETGFSLHAWQLQMKCKMADELMQYEPSITLKEVAATYGFCDEYHCGKCFKKIMGHSPKGSS